MAVALTCTLAFTAGEAPTTLAPPAAEQVNWMTWEEAIKASEKKPKKMFIDVYTDWCGWCKKMDKSTFQDPKVIKYLNDNFYAVKFNAEQRADIQYKNHTLKYIDSDNGRGVHELAYALLDGRLGYPAFVYLDENQDRITISPGYKDATAIVKELRYIQEGLYRTQAYDEYLKKAGR